RPVESVPPKVGRAIATLWEHYSGPLPHPRIFAQFEKVLPGSAERILAMAERQQAHRIKLEATVIQSDARNSTIGLVGGFILYVLFGIGSFYLIANGHGEIGVAFIIIAIAVLGGSLGVAYFGRQNQLRVTRRNPSQGDEDNEDEEGD
ncbi:MAG: DUF2335 domain-containing protein, partial [Chloroflexi bacterium]|nr:DUF2335 domain-containing protein [Chloroflexota bacterium]